MRLGSSLREAKVWELLFERSNKLDPDLVLSVVFLIVIPFLYTGIAAYWGDVHHSVPDHVKSARRSCSNMECRYLNSTKVPLLTGHSTSAR